MAKAYPEFLIGFFYPDTMGTHSLRAVRIAANNASMAKATFERDFGVPVAYVARVIPPTDLNGQTAPEDR